MPADEKNENQEKPIGITLRLPPDLWELVHAHARRRRTSLQKLMIELLERELKASRP
jgi:predicted HicB family RNase H-like nuclease